VAGNWWREQATRVAATMQLLPLFWAGYRGEGRENEAWVFFFWLCG